MNLNEAAREGTRPLDWLAEAGFPIEDVLVQAWKVGRDAAVFGWDASPGTHKLVVHAEVELPVSQWEPDVDLNGDCIADEYPSLVGLVSDLIDDERDAGAVFTVTDADGTTVRYQSTIDPDGRRQWERTP